MRNPVNRQRAVRLLAVLALLVPGAAGGEPGAADKAKLWVPALAVYGSVLAPQAEATAKHPPAPNASSDLASRLRANAATERWLPALAVIVPASLIAGAVASSASAGAPGERPAAIPVFVTPAQVAAIPAAPRGDPAGAAGEPEAKDETERWVPALAVFSGALVQSADGAAQSHDQFDYELITRSRSAILHPDGAIEMIEKVVPKSLEALIAWNGVGGDLVVGPVVAGSAELMTPGLQIVPGRPRLFVHGDVAGYFGPDRDVAKSGAPDTVELPTELNVPALVVKGQGIATRLEVDPVLYSAGAGVALTVDAWGRRFRIRPSFEWLREEIEVSGVMNQVFLSDTGRGIIRQRANQPFEDLPAVGPEYFIISVEGSEKKTYHGIGPGLEIEMDAARAGPVMLTLFVSGKAYKMLGDLGVEFTGETIDEHGTHTASWSFEKDPWSYQGNVGVRFRWLPE